MLLLDGSKLLRNLKDLILLILICSGVIVWFQKSVCLHKSVRPIAYPKLITVVKISHKHMQPNNS